MSGPEPPTRSGFVALAGRPNAGKSTLVNVVVGEKVAIVSDKPQTTRRVIRGVATGPDWQLVLVDLPGVQRPRDALTERMAERVTHELGDCDAAVMVIDGAQSVGPGDRFIARTLGEAGRPVILAVNKLDRLDRAAAAAALQAASQLLPEAEVFPISARRGTGVPALVEHLVSLLAPGPFYFPAGQRSDLPEELALAELVREQVLSRTRQEVPHAVEVSVDELERSGERVTVRAHLWVETESQKGILIGAQGRMIKAIGTAARRALERRLHASVHLELRVQTRRRWRADEALLDRLGI